MLRKGARWRFCLRDVRQVGSGELDIGLKLKPDLDFWLLQDSKRA
jgi:hypothetical protein